MKKVLTLCLIQKEDKILLGMKKRGFGVGRWNGFGGKLDGGETIEQGAKREILEESEIEAQEISKKGIITFEFENQPKTLEVHIFKIEKFSGEAQETEEMKPQWFSINEIPFDKMWTSDLYWFPLFLEDKKFKGYFLFDCPSDSEYSSKIIKHNLEEVENL